jgi:hypothetical protein
MKKKKKKKSCPHGRSGSPGQNFDLRDQTSGGGGGGRGRYSNCRRKNRRSRSRNKNEADKVIEESKSGGRVWRG